MKAHNQIRLEAAKKLAELSGHAKDLFFDAARLTAALETTDAQADYAIARLVDRLRARHMHAAATLIEHLTMEDPNPKDPDPS